ncbi:MAG: small, acid-soluble spore protein, alpha/beta type [Mycobacterium leprae]
MANFFPGTTNTAGGGGGGNNEILVNQARSALENLKNQTAAELGIQNYQTQYKGDLPSRVNGSVGGFMVKKMIALAEQQLSGNATR